MALAVGTGSDDCGLGHVSLPLVVGTAVGFTLSLWAGKFIGTLLFRVDARDPLTLGGAAAVLIAVGLFAGRLPARSISRLDPTTALRQ